MTEKKRQTLQRVREKVGALVRKPFARNILILIVVFFVYGESINYGYNIDDGYYIDILPDEDGIVPYAAIDWFNESEYRPATALTLAIEQHVYGRKADVFHLFNIIYFTLLCWLILRIFGKLQIFPDKRILLLFVIIFAVHPIHANAVASIKNREVILALIAGLQGSYMIYRGFTAERKRFFLLNLLGGTLLVVLASLFKTDGMITLALVPALLIYKRQLTRRLFRRFGFLVVGMVLVFLFKGEVLQNKEGRGELSVAEYFENSMTNEKLTNTLPYLAKGFMKYVEFHIIPTGYHFYFGYRIFDVTTWGDPKALLGALIFLFGAGMLFYRWRYKEPTPMELGGWIFFGMLFPYVYLMGHIAGVLAVRYAFYASLGFCLFLAGALGYLIHRRPRLGWGLSVFICMVFAVFAMERTRNWVDIDTLYATDMPHLTDSYVANRMVSDYHFGQAVASSDPAVQRERLEESLAFVERSIAIYDQDFRTWKQKANILARLSQPDSAYACYQKALSLEQKNVRTWLDFALFAEAYGLDALNLEASKGAYAADPTNSEALQAYSEALVRNGKYDEAIRINRLAATTGDMAYFPYVNLSTVYHAQADTLSMLHSFFKAFENGFVDDPVLRSVRGYVINRQLDTLRREFPEFF